MLTSRPSICHSTPAPVFFCPVPVLSAQRRHQIASLLRLQPERALPRPTSSPLLSPLMGPFFSAVFSLGYVLSSVPPSCLTSSPPRYKTVTMLIRRRPLNPLISLRKELGLLEKYSTWLIRSSWFVATQEIELVPKGFSYRHLAKMFVNQRV